MAKRLKVIGYGLMILVTASVCIATAAPQSRCLARKTGCAWKKADALLKCEQKAETPGRSPDPNAGGCIDKARLKFDGGSDPASGCVWRAFVAHPAGCITTEDGPALETLIDGCVSQIVAAI